jgi:predicted small lipoprotein YifL|tara:strand:- start:641 stop:763 length:123 start_codon:yes stop_codon:yes gene_type:complete
VKNFLYIISFFVFLTTFSSCGKKGDLEKPEKNYPKEYPSE